MSTTEFDYEALYESIDYQTVHFTLSGERDSDVIRRLETLEGHGKIPDRHTYAREALIRQLRRDGYL